jgi:hypothetical protein
VAPKKALVKSCTFLNRNKRVRDTKEPTMPIEPITLENNFRELIRVYHNDGPREVMDMVEIPQRNTIIIKRMISSQEYAEALEQELIVNLRANSQEEYQFYTDGAMGKTKDQYTKMGVAWIQTKGPNIGRTFSAGLENWPSAYKAEAIAILLVLLSIPTNSKVEIATDNQNCVNMIKKIVADHPKQTLRKWMKEKN